MKKPSQRKWKNYLIYPRFQVSLIVFNLSMLLGSLGLIYYQINKSFWVIENYARALKQSQGGEYVNVINLHLSIIEDFIMTTLIVCTAIITLYNLVFTHKSSGAIYRLKTYFRSIKENGYSGPLSFREGDLHGEIPQIVNDALSRIQSGEQGVASEQNPAPVDILENLGDSEADEDAIVSDSDDDGISK